MGPKPATFNMSSGQVLDSVPKSVDMSLMTSMYLRKGSRRENMTLTLAATARALASSLPEQSHVSLEVCVRAAWHGANTCCAAAAARHLLRLQSMH